MPTILKLKNSVTAAATPTTLVQGEAAVNVTDKKVWVGNAASSPVQILGAGASLDGMAIGGTTAAAGKFTTLEATGVTTIQAGTVSAPAITTSGDTNTGIYFPAADTIAFTEGGAEAMRIDSSGRVGIGTTSPSAKLNVIGGNIRLDNNQGLEWAGSNNYIYGNETTDFIAIATNGNEAMRINSSGALLVGTTTVYNTATTNVGFVGNVGSGISINSTTNTNGATYEVFLTTGTLIGSISNNNNTGVLYNVTSDYRLKNNAVALTGAKDFVMALKPKAWDWYNDLGKGVGFLAHEFMEVAKYSGFGEKDAVDSDGKPIYQTIQASSTEVMANIVALIQEQQALIENLTTRLNALEGN